MAGPPWLLLRSTRGASLRPPGSFPPPWPPPSFPRPSILIIGAGLAAPRPASRSGGDEGGRGGGALWRRRWPPGVPQPFPAPPSPAARALDKVIKHSSWRRLAALVAASKSALDLITSAPAPEDESEPPPSPVPGIPAPAADAALSVLLLALDPASPKVAEAALECVAGLLSLRRGALLRHARRRRRARARHAARAPRVRAVPDSLRQRGEPRQVVKAWYNVYLGSASGVNQLGARS